MPSWPPWPQTPQPTSPHGARPPRPGNGPKGWVGRGSSGTAVRRFTMQITIIGAGNMARGIAIRALAGGHTVRIIDRAPDEAARLAAGLQENAAAADVQAAGATGTGGADIVVLALPYHAARQAAAQ